MIDEKDPIAQHGANLTRRFIPVHARHADIEQCDLRLELLRDLHRLDPVPRDRRQLAIRTTAAGPGTVAVAVTDTGVGLDPAHAAHLFDPFFTTKPGGMGMGLAICKSIVEAHGGRIDARANPGRGATFALALPGIREGDP